MKDIAAMMYKEVTDAIRDLGPIASGEDVLDLAVSRMRLTLAQVRVTEERAATREDWS